LAGILAPPAAVSKLRLRRYVAPAERPSSLPVPCAVWKRFDLAAIYLYDRSALGEIAQSPAITHHVVSSALNRLNFTKHQYQSEMRQVINSTPRGEEFIDKSCEIALEALREIQNLIPKNETKPSNGMSFS
jgi:hypothetical protein